MTDLGRMYISGSGTHTVKLVLASSAADVPGGSVSITGGTPGQFHYAALTSPVTLLANTAYYIVSQETIGGDPWYDYGPVATTSAASIIGQVYRDAGWVPSTGPNQSYGPLNFQYAVSTAPVSVSITGPVAGATAQGNYEAGSNRMYGLGYDLAGNQLTANGDALGYDAENRQVTVTEPPSLGGGKEYIAYDGDGKRVAKSGPGRDDGVCVRCAGAVSGRICDGGWADALSHMLFDLGSSGVHALGHG